MSNQDRKVVKDFLQSLTDNCLFISYEYSTIIKHFNITTTYQFAKYEPDEYQIFGTKGNWVVDVISPENIDSNKHGVRHEFDSEEEANAFAKAARATGDDDAPQDEEE